MVHRLSPCVCGTEMPAVSFCPLLLAERDRFGLLCLVSGLAECCPRRHTCQSFVWKGPPSPCCWRLFVGCHCLPRLTTPSPRLTENKTRSFLNLQIIKQLFFSSFRFHISHLCLQSGLHVGVQGKRCSWVWGSQEESQAVRPLPHPCPELGTEAPCLGHLLLARYCS